MTESAKLKHDMLGVIHNLKRYVIENDPNMAPGQFVIMCLEGWVDSIGDFLDKQCAEKKIVIPDKNPALPPVIAEFFCKDCPKISLCSLSKCGNPKYKNIEIRHNALRQIQEIMSDDNSDKIFSRMSRVKSIVDKALGV